MNERIKQLRKTLKLSGAKFGEKIGISNAAVSFLESGRNNATEQTITSICREYHVNGQWLRTGEGEMFAENDESIIAALTREFNLDDFVKQIVAAYLKLPIEQREGIQEYLRKLNADN
ncbi:MAG: helix-turn-helix transcriptional regulator [Eubacteriales bacterium]|nr:helix-turn-helix transcriptional regulator [Eubacteriales bacterium]